MNDIVQKVDAPLEEADQIVPVIFQGEDRQYRRWEPTQRQKYAVDMLVQYQNWTYVTKLVNEKFKCDVSDETVKRWLDRKEAQEYMQARLTDKGYMNGMTEERWEREAIEYRDGTLPANSVTCFMHKLIGLKKGYLSGEKVQTNNNVVIAFTQANGDR